MRKETKHFKAQPKLSEPIAQIPKPNPRTNYNLIVKAINHIETLDNNNRFILELFVEMGLVTKEVDEQNHAHYVANVEALTKLKNK